MKFASFVFFTLFASWPCSAAVPEGDSLTPWLVLPAQAPTSTVHVELGGHVSIPQPSVPARVRRLDTDTTIDGKVLPAGSLLAFTVATSSKLPAWCVLPSAVAANAPKAVENAWGGSIFMRYFKTAWGGSTKCLADVNGDGLEDTQLDGKFDSLGLPSVRRLTGALPLANPVKLVDAEPTEVKGFSIGATIIYSDVSKRRSSWCMSLLPSEIKKARPEIEKRRSVITLVQNDGTACFAPRETALRPKSNGELPAVPGTSLNNRGAELVVESISQDSIDVRLTALFEPYLIATRTERSIEFEVD